MNGRITLTGSSHDTYNFGKLFLWRLWSLQFSRHTNASLLSGVKCFRAQCQREALGTKEVFFAEQESSVPDHKHLLPEPLAYRSRVASGPVPWICEMLGQVVAPVLVLSVGIFCSIAALWTIGQD